MKCDKCGNEWEYKGKSTARYIHCSQCGKLLKNPLFNKPLPKPVTTSVGGICEKCGVSIQDLNAEGVGRVNYYRPMGPYEPVTKTLYYCPDCWKAEKARWNDNPTELGPKDCD